MLQNRGQQETTETKDFHHHRSVGHSTYHIIFTILYVALVAKNKINKTRQRDNTHYTTTHYNTLPNEIDQKYRMAEEPSAMEIDGEDAMQPQNNATANSQDDFELDCYPYTFSPLLLFAESNYFDKGYSNYNSVHQFFSSVLPDDVNERMNTKVLYERKNMLYEDLLDYVTRNEMLVTCCIDDHFTAFQILESGRSKPCLIYYDPASPHLQLVTDKDGYQKLALYLLLKCNYGDSQHIQENKGHYVTDTSHHHSLLTSATNALKPKQQQLRKTIYTLWKGIHNTTSVHQVRGISFTAVPLKLDRYVLFNHPQDASKMSTQLTGNTCYFQTYLFVVLCQCTALKVKHSPLTKFCIEVEDVDRLEQTAVNMSRFLLEFFVEQAGDSTSTSRNGNGHHSQQQQNGGDDVDSLLADLEDLGDNGNNNCNNTSTNKRRILRPLTNSNFIVDFYRYKQAPYYRTVTNFLKQYYAKHTNPPVLPDYESQYHQILNYYETTKCLHTYDKFSLDGPMSSTLNTKSLQLVTSCGSYDSVRQLASSDYYKYRAANFMFGFNAGIVGHLESFCEFNAWRKNQLLRYCGSEPVEVSKEDDDDGDEKKEAKKPRPSIEEHVTGIVQALAQAKGATKYRDYCELSLFILLFV